MASSTSERASSSRMSAENRRQQIIAIAGELFSQKGFRGTTTKEIAERAGISEAIIFRHFASKDELYTAILTSKIQQAGERLDTQLAEAANRKDDKAFFGMLAFEMLEFHCKDESFIRLLLYSALEGHDLSTVVFHSAARDFKRRIHRYIQQRIADGAFRQINPAVAARTFVGMVMHHAEMCTIFKATDDMKISNKQIAERFVEIFLNGVSEPSR